MGFFLDFEERDLPIVESGGGEKETERKLIQIESKYYCGLTGSVRKLTLIVEVCGRRGMVVLFLSPIK